MQEDIIELLNFCLQYMSVLCMDLHTIIYLGEIMIGMVYF